MKRNLVLPIVGGVLIVVFIISLVAYGNWQSHLPFVWKQWKQNFFTLDDAIVYLNENLDRVQEVAPEMASYDNLTYLGCTFQFENVSEPLMWHLTVYWVHFYLWAKR